MKRTDTVTGETVEIECDVSPKWLSTRCGVKTPWTDTPAPACEKCGSEMAPLLDSIPIVN